MARDEERRTRHLDDASPIRIAVRDRMERLGAVPAAPVEAAEPVTERPVKTVEFVKPSRPADAAAVDGAAVTRPAATGLAVPGPPVLDTLVFRWDAPGAIPGEAFRPDESSLDARAAVVWQARLDGMLRLNPVPGDPASSAAVLCRADHTALVLRSHPQSGPAVTHVHVGAVREFSVRKALALAATPGLPDRIDSRLLSAAPADQRQALRAAAGPHAGLLELLLAATLREPAHTCSLPAPLAAESPFALLWAWSELVSVPLGRPTSFATYEHRLPKQRAELTLLRPGLPPPRTEGHRHLVPDAEPADDEARTTARTLVRQYLAD